MCNSALSSSGVVPHEIFTGDAPPPLASIYTVPPTNATAALKSASVTSSENALFARSIFTLPRVTGTPSMLPPSPSDNASRVASGRTGATIAIISRAAAKSPSGAVIAAQPAVISNNSAVASVPLALALIFAVERSEASVIVAVAVSPSASTISMPPSVAVNDLTAPSACATRLCRSISPSSMPINASIAASAFCGSAARNASMSAGTSSALPTTLISPSATNTVFPINVICAPKVLSVIFAFMPSANDSATSARYAVPLIASEICADSAFSLTMGIAADTTGRSSAASVNSPSGAEMGSGDAGKSVPPSASLTPAPFILASSAPVFTFTVACAETPFAAISAAIAPSALIESDLTAAIAAEIICVASAVPKLMPAASSRGVTASSVASGASLKRRLPISTYAVPSA